MMRSTLAAAFVALVLAVAGAGVIRAADTLGASVTPTPFYATIHSGEPIRIVNIGSVDAKFTLEIENNTGWQLALTSFTLAPNEAQEVEITKIGTGKSTLLTHFTNADAPNGMEAGSGTVSSTLRLAYEEDLTALLGAGIIIGLIAIAGLAAFATTYVRRRKRFA